MMLKLTATAALICSGMAMKAPNQIPLGTAKKGESASAMNFKFFQVGDRAYLAYANTKHGLDFQWNQQQTKSLQEGAILRMDVVTLYNNNKQLLISTIFENGTNDNSYYSFETKYKLEEFLNNIIAAEKALGVRSFFLTTKYVVHTSAEMLKRSKIHITRDVGKCMVCSRVDSRTVKGLRPHGYKNPSYSDVSFCSVHFSKTARLWDDVMLRELAEGQECLCDVCGSRDDVVLRVQNMFGTQYNCCSYTCMKTNGL